MTIHSRLRDGAIMLGMALWLAALIILGVAMALAVVALGIFLFGE